MPLRVFFNFLFLCLAASACKNEPYQFPPLGVTSLTNHVSTQTSTYSYRNGHIYTFQVGVSSTVWARMKFVYNEDQLQYILRDTTETSRKVITLYRDGNTVKDTTVLFEGNSSRAIGARSVTYDNEGHPVIVHKKDWPDTGTTEGEAELVWEDGNVVKLTTYTITDDVKTLVKELSISYDDQSCVFMEDPDYVYTLDLSELYWLSKNNPKVFNDGKGDKKYTYWYNKMGYPSNFKNELGTLFGANYTQVR